MRKLFFGRYLNSNKISLKDEFTIIIPSNSNKSSSLVKDAIFHNELLYVAHQDTFVTVT